MIMRMVLPRLLPWAIGLISVSAIVSYVSLQIYNRGVGVGARVIVDYNSATQAGVRDFNAVTARENTEYRLTQERGQAQYPAPMGDQ